MSRDPATIPRSGWLSSWPWVVVMLAAVGGLAAIADQAWQISATYDEVTYLRVGSHWWRTGAQAEMTRMGSPLVFWKLQQVPTLWAVDHWGHRAWIDDPIYYQAHLLPLIRIGGSWIWLASLLMVAAWSRSWYGERAMAFAAMLFALSPNLLAHGVLATMELPITAATVAVVFAFSHFVRTGSRPAFWGSAVLAGLAFACKYTAVLLPPILAVVWAIALWRRHDSTLGSSTRKVWTLATGMAGFVAVLVLTDFILTGGARLPLSPRSGDHPVIDHALSAPLARLMRGLVERSYPCDWVGFLTQMIYQRRGGPSYLFGERRSIGWWYYYLITLAVKVPLAFWFLLAARVRWRASLDVKAARGDWIIPVFVGVFLLATLLGSKRNYGFRYLLPLAPLAIVYVSALANVARERRWVGRVGLLGMAVAVAAIHPYELSYFNILTGGPIGGRRVLADSNLDWGQGAVAMARLQAEQPEFRDLTWYYFGDTDPEVYGVVGRRYLFRAHRDPTNLPPAVVADTSFLAVSASLQWGPWGPDGYFQILDPIEPVRYTADRTVAIYRTLDLIAAQEAQRVSKGRGPE